MMRIHGGDVGMRLYAKLADNRRRIYASPDSGDKCIWSLGTAEDLNYSVDRIRRNAIAIGHLANVDPLSNCRAKHIHIAQSVSAT